MLKAMATVAMAKNINSANPACSMSTKSFPMFAFRIIAALTYRYKKCGGEG